MSLVPYIRRRRSGGSLFGNFSANSITPELVADFAGANEFYGYNLVPSTFSDMMTVSTTGLATMTDSDGLVKWNAHNYLTYSEDLTGADWSPTEATTASDSFTASASSNQHFVMQNLTPEVGVQYTIKATVDARADAQFIQIAFGSNDVTGNPFVNFDLSAGSITADASSIGTITETSTAGVYVIEATVLVANAAFNLAFSAIESGADSRLPFFDPTGATLTYGMTEVHVYRSDLGGMVNNPDRTDTYVPTTAASVFLPRRNAFLYDASVAKWNAHNDFSNSEDLTNAAWIKANASVTADAALAPDGTMTADKLIRGVSSAVSYAYANLVSEAGPYSGADTTFSFYVKAAGYGFATVSVGGTPSDVYSVTVDLSDGSVTQNLTAGVRNNSDTVTDAGDGWYKIEITGDPDQYYIVGGEPTGTYADSAYGYSDTVGNGTDGIYVWGAMLNRGDLNGVVANSGNSVSGLYVPTTTTVVPATLNTAISFPKEGLRWESAAATNLITYSGDPSNVAWTQSSVTIGSEVAGGTFGTYRSVTNNTTGNIEQLYQIGKTITSGVNYCGWAVVKYSAGSGWININMYDTVNTNVRAWFDAKNGVVGTADAGIVDHGVEDLGDGWYLLWVVDTSASTSGGVSFEPCNADGATTTTINDALLFAGAQYELGSVPSSYIPTNGAVDIRPLETISIAGAKTPANTTAMSYSMKVLMTYADDAAAYSLFRHGSTDRAQMNVATSGGNTGRPQAALVNGATVDSVAGGSGYLSPGVNVALNAAVRFNATTMNVALDGTALTEDATLVGLPDLSASAVNFFLGLSLSEPNNGFIQEFIMWGADIGDTGIAEAST